MASSPTPRHIGAIEIARLGKTYVTGNGSVAALADVDLSIAHGEFIALVGASGCGKSTLLRIVAGFELATIGRVTLNGELVDRPHPERGVVFQDYGLFPWLTVRENVAYGPRQAGASRSEAREIADRWVTAVGLERFAGKYPRQLSGGMQQRVSIARVLANDPAVLLMDEPFGALDALTRTNMQGELARIHRETGTTVVFVTHSIEEALFLADRVVVMAGGAAQGLPGHIKAIVPVELPTRDVTAPEFNALKRQLADMVHEGHAAAIE